MMDSLNMAVLEAGVRRQCQSQHRGHRTVPDRQIETRVPPTAGMDMGLPERAMAVRFNLALNPWLRMYL
jgi:hypothetical protein